MSLKKLVRDNVPGIIQRETGQKVDVRILDTEEYRHELKWKLLEEVREACAAESSDKFLQELADLKEVIDANLAEWNFTWNDLERECEAKCLERGGFDKKIFIIGVRA